MKIEDIGGWRLADLFGIVSIFLHNFICCVYMYLLELPRRGYSNGNTQCDFMERVNTRFNLGSTVTALDYIYKNVRFYLF